MLRPIVESFFDTDTATLTHLVYAEGDPHCALIDPVLDYNPASGELATHSIDKVLERLTTLGLSAAWILETHAHADHLSASHYVKSRVGGRTGIGEGIRKVQETFRDRLGADDLTMEPEVFDHLFKDGESFSIGPLRGTVLSTPGHTPACVSYQIGDAVFVGDTLFMPDYGTARTDFPGGDAHQLYHSIQKLLTLPDQTRLFLCHDYAPNGRPVAWETSVAAQRQNNILIHEGTTESDFVTARQTRDAKLAAPRLLWPSLQVNLRGGRLPPARERGGRFLCAPLTVIPDELG